MMTKLYTETGSRPGAICLVTVDTAGCHHDDPQMITELASLRLLLFGAINDSTIKVD